MPRLSDDALIEKLVRNSERTVLRYNGVRCLEWQLFTHKGYGRTRDGERKWRVHVLAWDLLKGPLPEGHGVLHRCDTRACWEESHLWTGTPADNIGDAAAKDRMSRHHQHCERRQRDELGRFLRTRA